MQSAATLTRQPAGTVAVSRWGAWLRRAWDQLTLAEDERFLRAACDPVDLERRLRRLERGRADRFGPLDPHA
jgi:hypothetical protein